MASAVVPGESHPQFCSADADVIIKSSDGVFFRIHRLNLQANSDFAPPEISVSDVTDPACFDEPSEVLEVLFKYLYHNESPSLENLSREVLVSVGRAAHKYQMGFAIRSVDNAIFKMHSGYTDNYQYVEEILAYAVDFMKDEQLDEIALGLFLACWAAVTKYNHPTVCFAYLLYKERWVEQAGKAMMGEGEVFEERDARDLYSCIRDWVDESPSRCSKVRFSECLQEVRAMQSTA
ncbi:hypothetical protein CYLTODRAFT_488580 [Cylindrobasidium torrendii FP15055 ss-10]|uniref:BTB domain-containing protein n=1 Tax=Cylindrobasidium torrendii FP15055 ss-10 TaxID=1314674 RepID=A0A0D7BH11_9AGAR|nr:hypothetical protein CYLTODRAFT_488580 [Cylindrobasidium torrendii FP15055 ss-10]